MSVKGNCIYPSLRQPPKNKMSAKKKYFTINFMQLIHKACQILSAFTNKCQYFHLRCHSTSVPSTALDIHHFLEHFTVTYGEMHCRVVMIHID